ncbi:MAG: M48 family metallopeptidase [Candidatus Accumulibacter sp.]|jgi:putative metalloprotease|nr:M48 family metallopeptidase [Accumulibacter sp.]
MNRAPTTAGNVLLALLLAVCLNAEGKDGLLSGFGGKGLSAATDVVKAATVSDAELQSATRQMMEQMDGRNPVAPPNDKYGKRLAGLTKGLANEDGLKLNFKAYLVKDINAFATPDGSIRVFAGLMDKMTDDELRSVIGHEIGHVKLGHSLKAARTAYLASAAAKVAGAQGGMSAQALAELAEKFVNAQFSQNQESESDTYGIAFLKRHGYNPQAAESAMRKLAELDGTASGGQGSLFSSHPGSRQRADRIHEMIAK